MNKAKIMAKNIAIQQDNLDTEEADIPARPENVISYLFSLNKTDTNNRRPSNHQF